MPLAGGYDWPYLTRDDPDVWLFQMHRSNDFVIFHPILLSLGAGFSAFKASVGVAMMVAPFNNAQEMADSIKAAVANGRKPVVVAVGFRLPVCTEAAQDVLRNASRAGADVVLYQTEQWPDRAAIAYNVEMYKAKEVWDYSFANLVTYAPGNESGVQHRYVPPGYLATYDMDVDLRSPLRDEGHPGFLGEMRSRYSRLRNKYKKNVPGLVAANNVWTAEALARWLSKYPLQVNIHKDEVCCPSINHLEAFRMSSLLSNKACVVSAKSHPEDEKRFEGMVHFAKTSMMNKTFTLLRTNVRGCQESAYALYKYRFDPARLLNESGFLTPERQEAWAALAEASPQASPKVSTSNAARAEDSREDPAVKEKEPVAEEKDLVVDGNDSQKERVGVERRELRHVTAEKALTSWTRQRARSSLEIALERSAIVAGSTRSV